MPNYMTEREREALRVALRLRYGETFYCACWNCSQVFYKEHVIFCKHHQRYLSDDSGVCPDFDAVQVKKVLDKDPER